MTDFTRRDLLIRGTTVLATATVPAARLVAEGQGETSAFETTRKESFLWQRLRPKMARQSSTRTGGRGSRSLSRMVATHC
jgi:hypothetical protein